MDAFTDEQTRSAIELPEPGRRRRRKSNPLVDAIRAIEPAERDAAIAAAIEEVRQEERRASLLDLAQTMPLDQLEHLLGAHHGPATV